MSSKNPTVCLYSCDQDVFLMEKLIVFSKENSNVFLKEKFNVFSKESLVFCPFFINKNI